MSLRGSSPRLRQHSFFRRNIAAVVSLWQHCVRFGQPEIWTLDLHSRNERVTARPLAGYLTDHPTGLASQQPTE